ncbi:beta-ketoacyl synthase chain length factor [Campylobacter vicugnae]|uniref:beta-ketoacyl synthase chain length factor n=1 Tax=Campylobacter vicugnae TaxID=1660076 RepID=UPI00254E70C0|nr:beta-ketoacyl synthase chain length factor [Campylobacter ovis]MDL0095297.1 beta-ketoacyl synthase chain length factor [Campylobacter ovis]
MQIGILKADAIISSNFILPDEFKSLNIYQKDFKLDFSALEQRRMGIALKSALSIVNSFDLSSQELKTIPIIFSSFSGESKQCVNLLKTLKDDFVSPTAFSLSVLNATPAQMAILYQNQNEISSISAKDSLEYGFINAFTKPNQKVILINYEEFSDNLEEFSYYTFGLLLDKNYTKKQCSLEYKMDKPKESKIYQSAFKLLKELNNNTNSTWSIESNLQWNWSLYGFDN